MDAINHLSGCSNWCRGQLRKMSLESVEQILEGVEAADTDLLLALGSSLAAMAGVGILFGSNDYHFAKGWRIRRIRPDSLRNVTTPLPDLDQV